MKLWLVQIFSILRMEMRKTFFAKRGLWVYLLALAPVLLWTANTAVAPRREARLARIAAHHPINKFAMFMLRMGMTRAEVERRLGPPHSRWSNVRRVGREQFIRYDTYFYTDGTLEQKVVFIDDRITSIAVDSPEGIDDTNTKFATMFQFYYLRLAIFFGCVGIFTNLIRGEMVDKSLHFYLLTPMRREVLLAGKFLAGLIATVVIFGAGTALQLLAMLWRFRGPVLDDYLHHHGWNDIAAYMGVTALACAGYGSVFLAAGLLFKNPIVPAAIVLIWEAANAFVPVALKKISVIYYLQSLCPVVAEPESDLSAPLRLLLSMTDPPGRTIAMGGIATFIGVILVLAAIRARKLEINYSAE